ncbi:MAG TPA: hypothetical protein VI670_27955 [Thermoanaerobaculia bacterium]|jgi:hypothetical protein
MQQVDLESLVRLLERAGILITYVFDHATDLAPEYLEAHFGTLAPITKERVSAVLSELLSRILDKSFEEELSAHGLTGMELAAKMAASDAAYDEFAAARTDADGSGNASGSLDDEFLSKLKRALKAFGIPLGSLKDIIPGGGAGELLQLALHAIEHTERKRNAHPTGRFVFTAIARSVVRIIKRRRSREPTPT